ncbi:MAG: flippase [Eisenbergiella sp.]
MKNKINTKINFIYNLAYQILAMILPLITAPYVSRVLGADGVGKYSYTASIALYFIYFGMLGISNYGNRSIARVRENYEERSKVFSSIYYMQLITTGLATMAYIIYIIWFAPDLKRLLIIQIVYVLYGIFDISWLFFGLEEFKMTAQRQMIIRIVSLVLVFTFVKEEKDLPIYTLIMCTSNLANALILWLFLPKKVRVCKVPFSTIFSHIKPCLVLFVPIIAMSVFGMMDKIMIGKLVSYEAAGYYENADKIVLMSSSIFASFNAVLMPKISNLLGKNDKERAMHYFGLSIELVMCLALAMCFGMMAVAEDFIPIFFGGEYKASINLMKGLAIGIPFVGWAQIYRVLYLIPASKDIIYLKSTVLGAIINFLLNIICISIVGTMGAVMGTVISQVFIAVFQTYQVRREINVYFFVKKILGYIVVGGVMFFVIRCISITHQTTFLTLLIEIIVGGSIYAIGSIFVMIKTKNELLISILQNIRRKLDKY